MQINYRRLIGGTTSVLLRIALGQAAAPSQGATGITSGGGTFAYWIREGGSTSSAIALVAGTTGTFSSGGFIQVDGVNMPGVYELGLPNAAVTSGALGVLVYIGGTAGITPHAHQIDLLPGDPYTALVQTTYAQPAAVIAATDTLANKIGWMAALARNKISTTATTQSVFQDGSTSTISTNTVSDDGTTAIRGQWS